MNNIAEIHIIDPGTAGFEIYKYLREAHQFQPLDAKRLSKARSIIRLDRLGATISLFGMLSRMRSTGIQVRLVIDYSIDGRNYATGHSGGAMAMTTEEIEQADRDYDFYLSL